MQASPEVHAERMRRLGKANVVRSEKKKIKADAKSGSIDVADLLRQPPAVIRKEPVGKVLTWFRGIGPAKAKQVVMPVTRSVTVPIGALSDGSRAEIARRLRTRDRRR